MFTNSYIAQFVLDGLSDPVTYSVRLSSDDIISWNKRIETERPISFFSTDGTLNTVNTRFLVTYTLQGEEEE